jgi:hypothetical protein
MTTKWTPGPWHVDQNAYIFGPWVPEDKTLMGYECMREPLIARMGKDSTPGDMRLIAAAPELVECLREFVEHYRNKRHLLGSGSKAQDHFIKAATLLQRIEE